MACRTADTHYVWQVAKARRQGIDIGAGVGKILGRFRSGLKWVGKKTKGMREMISIYFKRRALDKHQKCSGALRPVATQRLSTL